MHIISIFCSKFLTILQFLTENFTPLLHDEILGLPELEESVDDHCPNVKIVLKFVLTHSHTMTPFDASGKQAF